MTADSHPSRSQLWLNGLLALTTLLGAWLLFQVQPMVAKRLLPWFGGGTAVWTTAMLFFQMALLGGYLYAHLLASRLAPRRQVALHTGLLLAAVAMVIAVPVVPTASWQPATGDHPALRILVTLAACVGLPYIVLSATAPLVQVWFARANPGVEPYRLYALSNLGSLAALVSYPFLVEPTMGVARQGLVWSLLFGAFAVLCAASGALARRIAPTPAAKPSHVDDLPSAPADGRSRSLERFFWIALPACASVNLLAITAHLCMDVASLPLLWIAPMVAYLLSFILTFESDRWYDRRYWLPALAVTSFAAVYTWHNVELASFIPQLVAHLALVLAISMVCHGELARMRPQPKRLTAFYLSIAAGGALGGVLTAVVAPLVFADNYEISLGILAAWVLAIAVLVTDRQSAFYDGKAFAPLLGIVALLVALAVAMGSYELKKRSFAVSLARNFYGTLKVREIVAQDPDFAYYKLNNGRISHGAQYRKLENRRVPTQYYHSTTGLGLLLSAPHSTSRRVGIVGLGVGTVAAYADAGDVFRFYEINPQVIEFADEYFTYLSDARERFASVTVVPGDARLMLEQEEPQNYDLLVLDAFTSDAIPAHLLTQEAFELYFRHLRDPDGVLAVHISNRYLNLALVVQAAAEKLGLEGRVVDAMKDKQPAAEDSRWVLLYRPNARIAQNNFGMPFEEITAGRPPVAWTDDFNNLIDVIYGIGE